MSSEARTVFFHIGPPKTGSTSVQFFFRHNHAELEKHKLVVPSVVTADGWQMRNHISLAKCKEVKSNGKLKADAVLWPQVETIVAEGKRDILLSSEMFAKEFMTTNSFFNISKFFRDYGYRVNVIAYVRDQPGWLNSWYVQNQKRLFDQINFDDYIDRAMQLGTADPWKYMQPFIDNPDCDLQIVPFETAVKAGLEKDFAKRVGLPAKAKLEFTGHKNQNAGAKTVFAAQKIMRQLNHKVHNLDSYNKGLAVFRKESEARGWNTVAYVGLTPERVKKIQDFYGEGNEKFAQQFFGSDWASICPTKAYKTFTFDHKSASKEELDEIDLVVDKVVKRFRKLRRVAEKAAKQKPDETTALAAE